MKRSPIKRKTPLDTRAAQKRYEDRLRAEGASRFRSLGSKKTAAERREEFEREYGSEERVQWIQRQPCVFCGRTPCDNAHITNGGTGRKADAEYVVPACKDRDGPHGIIPGCHWEMDHGIGKAAMERKFHVDLHAEAERVDREWGER